MQKLNPDGLPHGCFVEGIRLTTTVNLWQPMAAHEIGFTAADVRLLNRSISRAVRERQLPSACELILVFPQQRTRPVRVTRKRLVPPAPSPLLSVSLRWQDVT